MLATEAAVMLLVVALYLQDSLLLLFDNEAVFEARGNQRYRAHLGAATLHLGGRNPCLPNPLTFWRPLFRAAWHATAPAAHSERMQTDAIERAARAARSTAWGLFPVCLGLFVGLPLCLYFNVGWTPFLTMVAAMYVSAIVVLWSLWRKRADIGIDRKRFTTLCFESLICLPCALNLVRKSSLGVQIEADVIELAPQLLSATDWRALAHNILRRVDEKIEAEEEHGTRWEVLTQYRTKLSGMMT
jgi:hypothetical protein